MSHWTDILSPEQLTARYELTAQLDYNFAQEERAVYTQASDEQLSAMMAGAWYANDGYGYQMARSHLAMRSGSTEQGASA